MYNIPQVITIQANTFYYVGRFLIANGKTLKTVRANGNGNNARVGFIDDGVFTDHGTMSTTAIDCTGHDYVIGYSWSGLPYGYQIAFTM